MGIGVVRRLIWRLALDVGCFLLRFSVNNYAGCFCHRNDFKTRPCGRSPIETRKAWEGQGHAALCGSSSVEWSALEAPSSLWFCLATCLLTTFKSTLSSWGRCESPAVGWRNCLIKHTEPSLQQLSLAHPVCLLKWYICRQPRCCCILDL